MTAINPYITFDGSAEEAFNFYKSVFGGEFMGGMIMRWGDTPGCGGEEGEMKLSEADAKKVMHIALEIGKGQVLMASDFVEGMGQKYTPGNNITIAISPESKEDADRLFNGLSAGGKVEMPMADAFWGGYFGSFTDRFDIGWLINYDGK